MSTPTASPAFWKVIEQARADAPEDGEALADAVRNRLVELDEAAIIEFQRELDLLMARMYTWDLWGAAYIMNGGCSDDGFEYWRCWLIAQGREICEAAMANPDTLAAARLRYGEEMQYECESLLYMPVEALEEKSGNEMPRADVGRRSEPAGTAWEEDGDDLERRFPKLWAKFSG